MDRAGQRQNDVLRRAIRDPGRVFDDAGVTWIVGSGADTADRARFVGFNAQLATAYHPDPNPLRMITAEAADLLTVGKQIGRLRPGMLADFVVWSGDPLDPDT
jgi:imidazolonepropionase-like amidohydrolase